MIDIRPGRRIKRVIILQSDGSGGVAPTTVYEKSKKRKKKKGSLGFRELERAVRGVGEAQQAFTDELLRRHRRSNRKSRDGWVRDLGPNVFKAGQKSMRKLMKSAGM